MTAFPVLRAPRSQRFQTLVKVLLVASVLEFLLIRIFSRMGTALPQADWIFGAYTSTIFFGSIMFNLASALAILVVAYATYLFLKERGRFNLVISGALLILTQLSILFLVTDPSTMTSLLYDVTSVALILGLAGSIFLSSPNALGRLMAILFAAAYASTYVFKMLPLLSQLSSSNLGSNFALTVFNIGEVVVLVNTGTIFFVLLSKEERTLGRLLQLRNNRASQFATFLAVVFLAAYLRSPWLTSIIATWTLGLTLFLPFPIYAVALWLFTYTATRLALTKHPAGFALLLILLGGRMLQLTYLNLLALSGLILLAMETKRTPLIPTLPD